MAASLGGTEEGCQGPARLPGLCVSGPGSEVGEVGGHSGLTPGVGWGGAGPRGEGLGLGSSELEGAGPLDLFLCSCVDQVLEPLPQHISVLG